jgi:aspartate kinase
MALYVYKFGGTSVGTVERIKAVAEKVKKARDAGDQIVVVVSAMSGVTDQLIMLAQTAAKGNEAYKTIIQNIH